MNIKAYYTKSEMEVNRNYPDILLVERYSEFEEIKDIDGLRKYTIVVAGNEIYVQEI